jgi:hypothetical protein
MRTFEEIEYGNVKVGDRIVVNAQGDIDIVEAIRPYDDESADYLFKGTREKMGYYTPDDTKYWWGPIDYDTFCLRETTEYHQESEATNTEIQF